MRTRNITIYIKLVLEVNTAYTGIISQINARFCETNASKEFFEKIK